AAGVLPCAFFYRRLFFLFAIEMRPEASYRERLNFLGGQRDYKDRTSRVTAAREFSEETARIFSDDVAYNLLNDSHVYIRSGKYMLYLAYMADTKFASEIPERYNRRRRSH